MAINIVANLEANTKEAVRQVDKVNEKVKEVSRNAKKAGDDLTESMVIGNAAVKQVDKVTGGLASSLVKVAKAAKLSGKAMRVALLSTGIGAITIAVGLLVEYWDEITDLIGGSNKAFLFSKTKDFSFSIKSSTFLPCFFSNSICVLIFLNFLSTASRF